MLLLFPRRCPQNCCKLVPLPHYKETQGSLCLGAIIRLLDVFLFCNYAYSRMSNSLVYRSKVAIHSLQILLGYESCTTTVKSLEFATELINPFKIFTNAHSKDEIASQSIFISMPSLWKAIILILLSRTRETRVPNPHDMTDLKWLLLPVFKE